MAGWAINRRMIFCGNVHRAKIPTVLHAMAGFAQPLHFEGLRIVWMMRVDLSAIAAFRADSGPSEQTLLDRTGNAIVCVLGWSRQNNPPKGY